MRTLRLLRFVRVLALMPWWTGHRVAAQAADSAGGPSMSLTDSASVPMELSDGRADVAVMLNGRGPYRLAVETGSPDVLVSPRVVADLALRAIGPGETDSLFQLDSLRIGKALVGSLPVGRDSGFARLGVDGVLGLIAYRDVVLTLDYPNGRLSLTKMSLPEPDGREVLRAVRVGPFIGIPITLGGVRETGVIDTQGGIGFQATPEVARRLTFQRPLRVVGRAVVGGGAPVEVKLGTLSGDVRLGRYTMQQPEIAVHRLPADIPSHVTIGILVLHNFSVAIDQRSMSVRLTRPDSGAVRLTPSSS
jgi:hypothetical protein